MSLKEMQMKTTVRYWQYSDTPIGYIHQHDHGQCHVPIGYIHQHGHWLGHGLE